MDFLPNADWRGLEMGVRRGFGAEGWLGRGLKLKLIHVMVIVGPTISAGEAVQDFNAEMVATFAIGHNYNALPALAIGGQVATEAQRCPAVGKSQGASLTIEGRP